MNNAVGITEFVHPDLPGVRGIIKSRFSDFIVREVTCAGEVLFLRTTSDEGLEDRLFGKADDPNDGQDAEQVADAFLSDLQAISTDLLNPSDQQTLRAYIIGCHNKDESTKDWTGLSCPDKPMRSTIHQLIKTRLGQLVESTTATINNTSQIKLTANHTQKQKRRRVDWPCEDFLQFTLLKENIDTMGAVSILAKHLHCKPDSIAYNGTKDKRGVTTQRCTLYRKKPSAFQKINSYPHNPTLRIGDFQYTSQPAKLGALGGNRFEIILRGMKESDESIAMACEGLKDGFINYFGLQRFGKGGSLSHEIGVHILKSDWVKCVEMLFTSKDGDREGILAAKAAFAAKNYKLAFDSLPEAMQAEKGVLRKLIHSPEDFSGAYQSIPKNMRLICVHAYQSYLWNMGASKRLKDFGPRCIVGDLVLIARNTGSTETVGEFLDEDLVQADGHRFDVRILTEADVSDFSMYDVALPLIGNMSKLPANAIGEYMIQLMAADGLSPHSFDTCSPHYRLAGSYRRILQEAKDLEWKIINYCDPAEELAETELTRFRDRPAEPAVAKGEAVHKALQLKFTLPPGTYATMALRELTKESTETDFHAQLNEEQHA